MTQRSTSVSGGPIVSPDRVADVMRRLLHSATKVTHRFTLDGIAQESGVSVRLLRAWLSTDEDATREPKMAAALSVAVVLGTPAVNAVLALIGYVGQPIEDVEALNPMQIVADSMKHFCTIASAAADGRIDHTEQPLCRDAADMIIATVLPLSSAGQAS